MEIERITIAKSVIVLLALSAIMFCVSFPPLAFAFHNDSSYDAHGTRHLRWTCDDGRFLQDTSLRSRSCNGDEALLDRRGYLYKNKKKMNRQPVLDFKLTKNGKIYYRLKKDRKLYSEKGLLNSGKSSVVLYLVSASDNVVYVNEESEIFKDGNLLLAGKGKISGGTRLPVSVSVSGNAVYINNHRDIFIDGKKLNRGSSKVSNYAVDLKSNIFFIDMAGRLFRNHRILYSGASRVQAIALGPRDEIAFLTSARTKNLHFKGLRYSAGVERIIDFEFNEGGDLIYQDTVGKRWKNGLLIFD